MKNRYFKWKYGWVALLVAAICACSENNELAQMVNKQEHQSGTRTANLRTETIELVEIETLETKLTEVMGEEDVSNLEKLIVSGPMSAKDFNYLQNNLIGLHVLDMSNARIVTSDEYYWSPYRGSVKLKNDTICEGMFYNFDNLSDVILPSSILYIDECAFANCDTLTSVVIPETVKILNACLFDDCNYLSSVTLPSGLEGIGRSVFHSCDSLKTIEIPDNVKFIGDNAFGYCTSLSSVKFSTLSELDSIAQEAFHNTNLKSIIIPNKVRYIGNDTFYNCSSLSSVSLPANLEGIEHGTFLQCDSLKSIVVPDKVRYIGESSFVGCNLLEKVEFSSLSELDSIANFAFSNTNFKSIIIPENVKFIGDNAFYSCDSLSSVILSSGLTYLGNSAFSECCSLNSVKMSDELKQINEYTFYNCTSLTSIQLPSKLESIGMYSFSRSALTHIVLPSNLKTISMLAFQFCRSLIYMNVPSSVTMVGEAFAEHCSNLQALFWEAPIDVPHNYGTFNCFLYIDTDQEITWDDSWTNVIKNGVAQSTITIQTNADNEFKILKGFTAPEVVYTRYFSGRTAPGKSSGWQTIVLPFTPDSIYHETKGRIAPFNSGIENTKPFWLRELTVDGFSDVTTMTPDKAYIIAMPNSDSYLEDYRLEGNITFTAKNVAIAKTPDTLTVSQGPEFDFYPSYKYVKKALYVYSLTSQYTYDGNINSYYDHSYFERSRDHVYPFNAYVSTKGGGRSSRSTFEIDGRSKNTRSADQPNKTGIPQIGDM